MAIKRKYFCRAGILCTYLLSAYLYAAEPVLVKDIAPDIPSTQLRDFLVVNDILYFRVNDQTTGSVNYAGLYKSDGTVAGTDKVFSPENELSNPKQLTAIGNTIFFIDYLAPTDFRQVLWKFDVLSESAEIVDNTQPSNPTRPRELFANGDTLYFSVSSEDNIDLELWKSDGTAVGTVLVKDINSNAEPWKAMEFASMGENLYFKADNVLGRPELWKSDGTTSGTSIVESFDDPTLEIIDLTVAGDKLYFLEITVPRQHKLDSLA